MGKLGLNEDPESGAHPCINSPHNDVVILQSFTALGNIHHHRIRRSNRLIKTTNRMGTASRNKNYAGKSLRIKKTANQSQSKIRKPYEVAPR